MLGGVLFRVLLWSSVVLKLFTFQPFHSDGTRESSIVTKRFIVDESVQQHSDEVDILEELDENQDEVNYNTYKISFHVYIKYFFFLQLNHLSNFTKWNSWTHENDSHMNPPNHGKQKPNGKRFHIALSFERRLCYLLVVNNTTQFICFRFNRNKDVSSPEVYSTSCSQAMITKFKWQVSFNKAKYLKKFNEMVVYFKLFLFDRRLFAFHYILWLQYLSLLLDRPSHEDNFDDGHEKKESVVELNKY